MAAKRKIGIGARIYAIVENPQTGGVSHTKLWANVACAAATWKFCSAPDLGADIWLVYLLGVGGYAIARRGLAAGLEPGRGDSPAKAAAKTEGTKQ